MCAPPSSPLPRVTGLARAVFSLTVSRLICVYDPLAIPILSPPLPLARLEQASAVCLGVATCCWTVLSHSSPISADTHCVHVRPTHACTESTCHTLRRAFPHGLSDYTPHPPHICRTFSFNGCRDCFFPIQYWCTSPPPPSCAGALFAPAVHDPPWHTDSLHCCWPWTNVESMESLSCRLCRNLLSLNHLWGGR